ncbi:cold-shock protein [Nocardia noduli]|uniref:cold-shock protein n=1 Tax=Nocardia noduli TaxID=2815722 RepID=UPI001C21313F|nr:cold-shock protein [Nocardia noduli]
MARGTVRWFNSGRGIGFIAPDNGADDIFVHHSEIQAEGFRELAAGQKVEYEPGQGPKGPAAKQVQVL